MFEWAVQQQQFKEEIVLLKEEKFREDSDIEKFAFFKIFQKVINSNIKQKIIQDLFIYNIYKVYITVLSLINYFQSNEAHKQKIIDARIKRASEWKQLKRKKKRELKEKYKDELRLWTTNEKAKRLKLDKKQRKKEYEQLRASYLAGRVEEIFSDKHSALKSMAQHQSVIPNQATTTGTNRIIPGGTIIQEDSDTNAQNNDSHIPSKRAKMLR